MAPKTYIITNTQQTIDIRSDDDKTPDDSNEVKHHTPPVTPVPKLYYLNSFDEAEFNAFRAQLPPPYQHLSRMEAENIVKEYRRYFTLNAWLNRGANATNILYFIYLFSMGSAGLEQIAKALFGPDTTISDEAATFGTVLVTACSISNALQWTLMYYPWNKAIKDTLRHATDLPFCERVRNNIGLICRNPLRAMKLVAIESILLAMNYTSAASNLIFIEPTLDSRMLSWLKHPVLAPLKWPTVALVLYLTARLCGQSWNESAYQGAAFWENTEGRTSLFKEFLRGNFIITIKAALEIIGIMIFRPMNYFFISEAANKTFHDWSPTYGGWIPGPYMAGIAFLHVLLINYQVTFNHALSPIEQLDNALKLFLNTIAIEAFERHKHYYFSLSSEERPRYIQSLCQSVERSIMLLPPDNYAETSSSFKRELRRLYTPLLTLSTNENKACVAAFKQKIIDINHTLLEQAVRKNKSICQLLLQDPLSIFFIGLNSLYGGYLGYRIATSSLSLGGRIACTGTGAVVLATFFGRDAINRRAKINAREIVRHPQEEKVQPATSSRKLILLSFLIAGMSALSNGMSDINSSGSLVGNYLPLFLPLLGLVISAILNDMLFTQPLILDTTKGYTKNCFWNKNNSVHPTSVPNTHTISEMENRPQSSLH